MSPSSSRRCRRVAALVAAPRSRRQRRGASSTNASIAALAPTVAAREHGEEQSVEHAAAERSECVASFRPRQRALEQAEAFERAALEVAGRPARARGEYLQLVPQPQVGEVAPLQCPTPKRAQQRRARRVLDRAQERIVQLPLDHQQYFAEQAVLRAVVVDEHARARARARGERSQREIGDAALEQALDQRRREFVLARRAGAARGRGHERAGAAPSTGGGGRRSPSWASSPRRACGSSHCA
jgi:hypothetical protein